MTCLFCFHAVSNGLTCSRSVSKHVQHGTLLHFSFQRSHLTASGADPGADPAANPGGSSKYRIATTTRICTRGRFAQSHAKSCTATPAPSYQRQQSDSPRGYCLGGSAHCTLLLGGQWIHNANRGAFSSTNESLEPKQATHFYPQSCQKLEQQ